MNKEKFVILISFQKLDNTRFFVATSGGETAVSYVGYTGKTSLHNELPEEVEQFLYNPYSATAIFLMKDSGRIMLYDTPKDHYMTENQGYVEGIGYFDTAEKYYRVETVNPDIQGQKTKITFWDMQTKQLVGQAVAESENLKMEFWDCMTLDGEESFEIEISETQAYSFFSDNIVIGPETMQAAIYLEENEIVIVDLNTGTITQRIPFLGKDGHVTKFFEHEQYLLFWGDEGVLTMWDLQGEKAIMTDIEKLNRVNNIYTDESAKYFGITTSHSTGGYTFCIYYVDDNYRFYHFADVEDGFASFLHEEVFCLRWDDVSYYTKFYDYITLKTRAEQLIGDTELTETEKRMYYLTEE